MFKSTYCFVSLRVTRRGKAPCKRQYGGLENLRFPVHLSSAFSAFVFLVNTLWPASIILFDSFRSDRHARMIISSHSFNTYARVKQSSDSFNSDRRACMVARYTGEVDLSTTLRVGSTPILERPHKNASYSARPSKAPGRKRPRSSTKPPLFRQRRGVQTKPGETTAEAGAEAEVYLQERDGLDPHARMIHKKEITRRELDLRQNARIFQHEKNLKKERDLGPHMRILHYEKRVGEDSSPTSALLGASSSSDRVHLAASTEADCNWSDEPGGRWCGWTESHDDRGQLRNGNDVAEHDHGRLCKSKGLAARNHDLFCNGSARHVASERALRPRPASASASASTEHPRQRGNATFQGTISTEETQASASCAARSTTSIAGRARHLDVEIPRGVAAGMPREVLTMRSIDFAAFK